MLPAYLSLYLGLDEKDKVGRLPGARLVHAAGVGSSVSAGFILLFAVAGLVISAGGRVLITAMPWLGGLVGLGLIVLGIALLAGRSWSPALFEQLADRIGPGGATTQRGFFLFGVAYGLASLSCTLPIFLVVVGNALTRGDLLGSMVQFLSYALGMATVVVSLTLALGVFKAGLVQGLRRVVPYVQRASAVLLLIAGASIILYWKPYL
jgi:cytochrome c-type biogenesis protein